MKEHWIKDIHDRLGNYEMDAPEGLWTDISNNLPKMEQRKASEGKHKPKAAIVGMRYGVAIVAAACVAVLLYYRLSNGKMAPTIPTNMPTMAATSPATGNPLNAIPNDTHTVAISRIDDAKLMAKADKITGNEKLIETENANSTEASLATNTDSAYLDTPLSTDNKKNAHNGYYPSTYSAKHTFSRHSSSSRWTISTNVMGGMGSSSATTAIADAIVAAGPDGAVWADDPMLGLAVYNQGRNVVTDVKHRLPVRFGIGLAYAISKKLSIESGITYTWLSSDIREGTADNYWRGEQKLHYVGIPVNLKYQLFASRHIGIYASAGMLAEQCVAGNTSRTYVMMGQERTNENQDIASKPFQLSANAAVGVQVDVADNIGIYAEPGLSYYFDDNSSLKTIYKEKPLNFNLNLGLRFTLNK